MSGKPGTDPTRGQLLQTTELTTSEAGASSLLLRVPSRGLALVLLANGEGVHWDNPLDGAAVERSPYARAFLDHFVFGHEQ